MLHKEVKKYIIPNATQLHSCKIFFLLFLFYHLGRGSFWLSRAWKVNRIVCSGVIASVSSLKWSNFFTLALKRSFQLEEGCSCSFIFKIKGLLQLQLKANVYLCPWIYMGPFFFLFFLSLVNWIWMWNNIEVQYKVQVIHFNLIKQNYIETTIFINVPDSRPAIFIQFCVMSFDFHMLFLKLFLQLPFYTANQTYIKLTH